MAEKGGINWGKMLLGAVALTGAALVAPSLMNGVADLTIGEGVATAAADAPFMDQVGEGARSLAGSLSATYAGVAADLGVNGANFSNLGGVYDAVTTAGQNAINWVGNDPTTAALAGGAGVATGAVLGQWTGKVADKGASRPQGSYADYVRARQQRAAMMAAQTRNA